MGKDIIKLNGKELNVGRVLLAKKKKTVNDFIKELEPNIENIQRLAHKNGTKAFKDRDHLKRWLIANQEGYEKFSYEIYYYFVIKLHL